jgi:DNA-binding SARP family transcriptional activator
MLSAADDFPKEGDVGSGSATARIADADGTGPRFRLQLIGRFAVWRDEEPVPDRDVGSRQGRTLLKVLLLHAHEPVSVDRLRGVLWGETPPDSAERNIASLVSRLRRLLGPDTIEGGPGAYRIRVGPGLQVDMLEVERLAQESRQRLDAGEPALAAAAVERALDLVGSATLLAGEPDQDWLAAGRRRLTSIRQQLRHRGADAALALQDPDHAVRLAAAALSDDPFDEAAARTLMRAHHMAGRTAEALRVHERLRMALADELGVDPSPPTRELHTTLLREAEPATEPSSSVSQVPVGAAASRRTGTGFVGRDTELAWLLDRWSTAIQGNAGLVLISGEAGIGKTRLAQELAAAAEETGGLVLGARCYEAERSLFLGPIVEVVGALAARTPPDRLVRVVDRWGGVLAALVPEIADILGPQPHEPTSPEIERRRIFDGIAALLQRASQDRPLVVFLDDLHNAGASTVELLHHLARRVTSGRLLFVATCRVEDGDHVLHELTDVAERIDLGPLSEAAVTALVRAAGAERRGSQILAATRGHTLAVVETLHALGDGDDGPDMPPVPASLTVAVEQRIARAGAAVEELVRGAATLGATFELATVAEFLELPMEEVVRRSERAVRARLLIEEGTRYAFSNDLIQQIVYDTTPRPVRVARHRRAAAILAGSPEVVAWHASAAEDWATAWPAWVDAADQAVRRYANRDAEQLLARAMSAAEAAGDIRGVARVRLIRARVREALAHFRGELDDLAVARELAHRHGHPDLEAAALRQLGGDVQVGLGRPTTDCLPYLEAGLDVARSARLGRIEVELQGRIAVIWSNRTRFDRAVEAA